MEKEKTVKSLEWIMDELYETVRKGDEAMEDIKKYQEDYKKLTGHKYD